MDHVRDLLTAAAADVGWQVDLDQLPVTCAHTPDIVVTLIDACAAHLAALAADAALTEATHSIQPITADTDDQTVDAFAAGLLATVVELAGARRSHTHRTRRRLIGALQALQAQGAAWPPPPTPSATPGPGLRQSLATLGLHQLPARQASTAAIAYTAVDGERNLTVTIHPGDDYRTEVHVFDQGLLSWSATFSPNAPTAVITAAVRDALPAAGQTAPAAG